MTFAGAGERAGDMFVKRFEQRLAKERPPRKLTQQLLKQD